MANDPGNTFYKPALLNFGLGLVAFIATASAPVGISLWSDVRMLARDLEQVRDELADLQDWRRDTSGFSPSDGRRLAERLAAIEIWMARHDALIPAPAPGGRR